MGFLDKITDAISNLSGNSVGGSVLGIDIGSSSIKLVQLRREDGRAILETYGAITLGPYNGVEAGKAVKLPVNKITEALSDLMRETNVTTKSVSVAIPFASSLTSIIQMPNMPKNQLNQMIPLEARKYIPVPMNEVMLDWFIIPDEEPKSRSEILEGVYDSFEKPKEKNNLEILLVAIFNTILNDYQTITDTLGLTTKFYELEVFSAARGSLSHGVAPVVIVDIGASTTKIYVVERGVIRMSHLVHKGSQDLTLHIERALEISFEKAERLKREEGMSEDSSVKFAMLSTLDHIFSQINHVLLSYGKKYHKNISKVMFSGSTAAMDGFLEYAESKIENVVTIANPFNKVQTPAFLDDALKKVGPEFAVATGLALRQLQS